jgi:5-formyltetrahydrofolate cyclo-ligase
MYVKDIRVVKTKLREKYKQLRCALDAAQKAEMDSEMQSRLLSMRQYAACRSVFTYVSKPIEVDTLSIIAAALANHKRVAVPRCIPGTKEMEFYWITSLQQLEPGAFGVLEPVPEQCEPAVDFHGGLCIVPGLSFDVQGFRLGYGKGYYDRFLSRFPGTTVGLCYSVCTQWKLPHGKFDRPVDFLLTEKYLRRTNAPQNKSPRSSEAFRDQSITNYSSKPKR